MSKPYFNMHRAIQATYLLPYLQQSSLKDTEPLGKEASRDHRVLNAHRVLEVLGRRMGQPPDPKSKRKRNPKTITDTCYPTLVNLCADTCLGDSTVRAALGYLIEWGFIRKTHDPGYVPHKGKHGPVYDHCRYWVVPEMWNQAWSPLAAKYEARLAGVDASPASPKAAAPANLPEISAADAEVIDNLGVVAPDAEPPAPRSSEDKETVRKIHELLKAHFGDHRTYKEKDADKMMSACVNGCIDDAGDADTCLNVLNWACEDDKRVAAVRDAKKLGGYIRTCFTGWCAEWRDQGDTSDDVPANVQEFIDHLCISGPGTLECYGDTYITEFRARLKDELGPHLLKLDEEDGQDGGVELTPTISRPYKIAYILRKHTGQEVTPDEVPSFVVGETIAQARWAVAHEPWASRLIESDEPMKYFIRHCRDIGKEMKGSDDATPSEKPEEESSHWGPINPPVASQHEDFAHLDEL